MPELPEVEAIASIVKRLEGRRISKITVLRGTRYFGGPGGEDLHVRPMLVGLVSRIGKYVVIGLPELDGYIVTHNAMTGYFDWEDQPWTFDYVEGARTSKDSDVRVRIETEDGLVLRFHDARLFGSMNYEFDPPGPGPELLETACGHPGLRVITDLDLSRSMIESKKPIKTLLMDQSILSGVGNIYSTEALHLVGLDPRDISSTIDLRFSSLILESLRIVVERCLVQINYGWLNVYRRNNCGSCSGPVSRVELSGRATYFCERCQT